jgi:L-alanine-DL-glutamate epimerase-like enolase superfamily enzyme
MRITALETLPLNAAITVHAGAISWLWVRVHTDSGLIGLGETYPAAATAEAAVHESLAPVLLGQDARDIARLWQRMFQAVSYHGWAGAEMRAISAVDLALWDLAGKASDLPVYRLLGGRTRERIRTYNTCYDHRFDFRTDADALATDLGTQGITAMKIWPFDEIALENGGQHITPAEIERGLGPVRKIRDAAGTKMDIAIELHGYWNLPSAVAIAKALEPYRPMWLEEALPQDNLDAYARLKEETALPLILSERLMTRWQFREVLERGLAQFVNPDPCWCGGLTEARAIATLAETAYVPVAPHNCGGPVLHAACLHLATAVPNLFILESVRRHYQQDYRDLIVAPHVPRDGAFDPPDAPGLGVDLAPALLARSDLHARRTTL